MNKKLVALVGAGSIAAIGAVIVGAVLVSNLMTKGAQDVKTQSTDTKNRPTVVATLSPTLIAQTIAIRKETIDCTSTEMGNRRVEYTSQVGYSAEVINKTHVCAIVISNGKKPLLSIAFEYEGGDGRYGKITHKGTPVSVKTAATPDKISRVAFNYDVPQRALDETVLFTGKLGYVNDTNILAKDACKAEGWASPVEPPCVLPYVVNKAAFVARIYCASEDVVKACDQLVESLTVKTFDATPIPTTIMPTPTATVAMKNYTLECTSSEAGRERLAFKALDGMRATIENASTSCRVVIADAANMPIMAVEWFTENYRKYTFDGQIIKVTSSLVEQEVNKVMLKNPITISYGHSSKMTASSTFVTNDNVFLYKDKCSVEGEVGVPVEAPCIQPWITRTTDISPSIYCAQGREAECVKIFETLTMARF